MIKINKGKLAHGWRAILLQTYFTFIAPLPVVILIAFFAGLAISIKAQDGLEKFGALTHLGQLWLIIMAREVAPLLTSILVIARSATAVAAETAAMKEKKEIEALQIMGIDPNQYVVIPRLIAGGLSVFCLAFSFVLFSLVGLWFAANIKTQIPWNDLLLSIGSVLYIDDFIFFILKTLLCGTGIFWIACHKGLSLQRASFEIPIVTTAAVSSALFWTIGIQFFLSMFFYLTHGSMGGI